MMPNKRGQWLASNFYAVITGDISEVAVVERQTLWLFHGYIAILQHL